MKPRVPVLTVLAIGLLLLLSGPSASAFPGQTSKRTLLVCSGGVCALGSGKVGANYGQDIAITGESCGLPCSTLPVFTVVAGSLPPGLFMPSTYGCCGDAIGGTPSQAGAFTFKIQVRDGAGDTARHGFSISIRAAAP
jgi:Putative Ig domain